MLSQQCKLQLEAEGKSGKEHFKDAIKTAIKLQILVPALIVHAVAPRCFTEMSEDVINRMTK
jgi:hypothetical protein